MKSIPVLFSLCLSVLASNVFDLLPENFDSTVNAGKPALVEFFAPWCGHCKKLAPTYEELADAFSHQKTKVTIAKMDADGVGRETGQKYGVTGFPTIKWFDGSDNEPETYSGGRELDDFIKFISEKTGAKPKAKPPPATVQVDADNFKEVVMDNSKDVLLAFTATWCGHCKAMKPLYEKASFDFLPESNCVLANIEADADKNTELSMKYGIQSFPTIKFFGKDGKENPIDYNGDRTEEAFVNYLNEKCGTFRAVGGGLNDLAGKISKLDDLAAQFYMASRADRQPIYKEALTVAESAGVHGQHYLKVMQKVSNTSDEYVTKESARLKSILDKKTLAATKLDEIKIKANILSSFAAKKPVAEVDSEEDVTQKHEEL